MHHANSHSSLRPRAILIAVVTVISIVGPVSASDSLSVSLSGFIKLDAFHDTRQVVAAREGTFLLYPHPIDHRVNPRTDQIHDFNEAGSLNLTAFFSRLRGDISAPSALGASTSGAIEVDFLGTANGLENIVRLRHAFVQLDWGRHALIAGQYWSPLFVPEVFPQTASFNLGVPIQPLAWFPQLRYTGRHGALRTTAALTMQRDGFEDIAGRHTQQQAGLPGGHLHVDVIHGPLLAGVGSYLRTVRPELHGDRFTSGAASAYVRYAGNGWALRAQGLYGSNMADHVMIGGYVETTNAAAVSSYRPLRTASVWTNVTTTGHPFILGLFAGYTQNLGLGEHLAPSETVIHEFSRGGDIAHVWRLSPQIGYQADRLRVCLEVEATAAAYADNRTDALRPIANGQNVTNVRTLLTVFLFF